MQHSLVPCGSMGMELKCCLQFYVEGSDAQKAQSDVAIAGLGWVSCGLFGRAKLKVCASVFLRHCASVPVDVRRATLQSYSLGCCTLVGTRALMLCCVATGVDSGRCRGDEAQSACARVCKEL
jgi:hypothetical protein